MVFKRRFTLLAAVILVCSTLIFSFLHLLPLNIFSIQQKPEPEPQKVYDYYFILDEADGRSLMYVPLVVNIGDEILTEENKLYKVVKIEENRAYARFVEDVNLDKYKKK
jgi:ABC-type dipeptide/oligopeptide/nickel transport system permease component